MDVRNMGGRPVSRAAGLVAMAGLLAYWFLQPAPLPQKGLAAALVAVSVARPANGLLIFAGLAPLSTTIGGLSGAPGMGSRFLELMVLGAAAGVLVRRRRPEDVTRIGAPAMLLAVVAVASAAAAIPASAAPISRGSADAGLLLSQLLDRQTAMLSPVWAPLLAALMVVECALLGWCVERTVRAEPRLATRLVTLALVGHAATAALSLSAVVGGAMRAESVLEALPRLLMTVRISMQTDVHAAASALLLAGVAGLGLMSGSPIRRAVVGVLLALVAAGLWTTGSRVAILLAVVATAGTIGWSAGRAGRRRLLVAAGVVLLIGAGAWLATRDPLGRYNTTAGSINARLITIRAGVQMFKEAPVFGIGIAKFYAASAAYIGPDEAGIIGYDRQNAHNNFVQALAEQGLVGLGALLWWLAVVLVGGARAQASNPDAFRRALLVGIVACIGTWLTGHPLLVSEFAFVFWLYAGILTALTPAPTLGRAHWLPWVLAAGVLVSAAPRAIAQRNAADLEHRGVGLSSPWQHDDAQRYREAGMSFALFLPATGRLVEVPMRRAPGAPDPLLVEIRIHGRLVDTIAVTGDGWFTEVILVPAGPSRFERVDFAVRVPESAAGAPTVLLRVGRTVPR